MRKLFYTLAVLAVACVTAVSCSDDDDNWSDYAEWREANEVWYNQQLQRTDKEGQPYFTLLKPDWYSHSGVAIHYFNDRALTEGNLSPMTTSRVTVKYKGSLYDGTVFDATTTGSDSVRTFQLSSTVTGWQIALTDMHVGDSAEVIMPYAQGYGAQGSSSINPYSALKFNIKLVDIPSYEIP